MLKTSENTSNTKRIVRTGDRYPAQGFQKVVQTFTAIGCLKGEDKWEV